MSALAAILTIALICSLLAPLARRTARALLEALLDAATTHSRLSASAQPAMGEGGPAGDGPQIPDWVNEPGQRTDAQRGELERRLLGARYLQAQGARDSLSMASIDSVMTPDELLASLAVNAEVLALQVAMLRGRSLAEALADNVDAAAGMLYGQSAA